MSEPQHGLWAKSPDRSNPAARIGESLLQHSLNVARMAGDVCRRLPLPQAEREALARVLMEAAAYHDLGKAATGFQTMLRDKEQRWGHRHETLSTALARVLNPQFEACALFAVLTHHRSIPNDGTTKGEKDLPFTELPPRFGMYSDAEWQKMCSELRENWDELCDVIAQLRDTLQLETQTISRDTPLIDLGIKNEWLDRSFRKQRTIAKEDKWRASLLRGLLVTSDHMASALDPLTNEHPQPLDIPRLVGYIGSIKQHELPEGKSLLPFQQRAAETEGDTILKAPTGSGKTLAALLWAARNQTENGRFFYVLPYTASINAMTDRLKLIFERRITEANGDAHTTAQQQRVGVLHHRNAAYLFRSMEEDETSAQIRNKQAQLLGGLAREMYHPIRVCTPHQILRFALCGRGWETGLSEFPHACFVFDEIHAFEPLLAGLTLATVRLLKSPPFNARILFASATIPRFLENIIRKEIGISDANVIAPDPNNELDRVVCDKVRHRVEVRAGSLLNNLDEIADEIEASSESALIVCNHVATSQQVWKYLHEERGFDDVMLLHARFNGEDRNRIERRITSEDQPAVLVATQAVEVSLDIDFDRGYTEPAPADALGQRLGRINRRGSRPHPAPVVIFDEPSAGHLYDETLTIRTVQLLRDLDCLTEAQLTKLVDEVYGEGYPPAAMENFKKGLENEHIANFADEIVAGTHRKWTDDVLDQSDGQVEVLPDILLDEYTARRRQRRYVEAGQLLVPIRIGQKFKAEKMDALHYNPKLHEYVTTLKYSSDQGLQLDARSENIF